MGAGDRGACSVISLSSLWMDMLKSATNHAVFEQSAQEVGGVEVQFKVFLQTQAIPL
jgi:hypothetical protein